MRNSHGSEYLLKVDLARFPGGLDVGSEREKSRMTPGFMVEKLEG